VLEELACRFRSAPYSHIEADTYTCLSRSPQDHSLTTPRGVGFCMFPLLRGSAPRCGPKTPTHRSRTIRACTSKWSVPPVPLVVGVVVTNDIAVDGLYAPSR
jgi:hypothetical protein